MKEIDRSERSLQSYTSARMLRARYREEQSPSPTGGCTGRRENERLGALPAELHVSLFAARQVLGGAEPLPYRGDAQDEGKTNARERFLQSCTSAHLLRARHREEQSPLLYRGDAQDEGKTNARERSLQSSMPARILRGRHREEQSPPLQETCSLGMEMSPGFSA